MPHPMHGNGGMHPPMMGGPHYHPHPAGMHGEYGGYAPPAPPPNSSYSFLDPIIPTAKMESPAQNLIKPQKEKVTEVYKKLYIGKIPSDFKDNIIERLLKACGGVESWKRAIDAEGNPKNFGYCEFEDVESAVVCFKVMNGLQIGDSKIMVSFTSSLLPFSATFPYTAIQVNADSKTKEFLNNWILKEREEWINQQKGMEKEIDIDEINRIPVDSQSAPWIKELISKHAGDIFAKFEEILNLKFLISEVGVLV